MDKSAHGFTLDDRKTMTVRGVTDTEKFEENIAVIYTSAGIMTVKGRGLKLEGLSIETGELTLTGEIYSVVYGDRDRKGKTNIWGKITR